MATARPGCEMTKSCPSVALRRQAASQRARSLRVVWRSSASASVSSFMQRLAAIIDSKLLHAPISCERRLCEHNNSGSVLRATERLL